MVCRVLGYLVEDFFQTGFYLPMPFLCRPRRIEYHPWNIEEPRIGVSGNLAGPETRRAPCTELRQRHAICHTAAKITDFIFIRWRVHLSPQDRHQIPRMQTIANLISPPLKPNVFQRAASHVRVDPKSENALIGPPELPRARKHTAPVYPNRKIEIRSVFQSQTFRCDFCAAIKGNRWHRRIALRNTVRRDTIREILLCHGSICFARFF